MFTGKIPIAILSLILVFGAGCRCKESSTPIDALLDRIGGNGTANRFITVVEPSDDGQDYFTLSSEKGKPKITGNSYLSVATGIGWYLKYYANISITWSQLTVDLTTVELPLPPKEEKHHASVKLRQYFNYCVFSYSAPFWDWERWEKEIDWMALHGINMPLAITGTEVVWYNLLVNGLGYTKEEANAFLVGAAYQPFFLMCNIEGWGGPNPDSWYERQKNLQQNILARMRELNMTPILAGYSGMVPHDIGTKKGWNITSSDKWCNFVRPEVIQTTEPQFNEMARLYYDEMKNLYGVSEFYSIDLFHEGNVPDGVNIGETYLDVYNAMKNYSGSRNPQWVIQQWQNNPHQEALDALTPGNLIVLELNSVDAKRWTKSFQQSNGTPHEFIFCLLNNFGGVVGLHGPLTKMINDFYEAKSLLPNTMIGLGATLEAVENNPVLYEALYEMPWRDKIDASEWIKIYPQIRYGKINEEAVKAWELLHRSVYRSSGVSESVLCARPALPVKSVTTWGTTVTGWDANDVRDAATLLLAQHNELNCANYRYDVVDVVRQTLTDYANEVINRIYRAHEAKEIELRNARIDTFLNVILDQDRLLSTLPDFMVGKWIANARKMGKNDAEKNLYERNARVLITTWGDREQANAGELHDYAHKEWSGLLRDYYYPRWVVYFDKLKAGSNTPFADELFDMEWAWATTTSSTKNYPDTPQEEPVIVARELFDKYFTYNEVEK